MMLFGGNEENDFLKEEVNQIIKSNDLTVAAPVSPTGKNNDMVMITAGTVIEGTLTSNSSICLEGTVKGSINSKSDISIDGTVEGDISVANITADKASITGDITSTGTATFLPGTKMKGNITADKIVVASKIEGDLVAEDSVILHNSAIVDGNITASHLEVQLGAVINGMAKTLADGKKAEAPKSTFKPVAEPPKAEPPKAEPVKAEPAKTEPAKTNPVK